MGLTGWAVQRLGVAPLASSPWQLVLSFSGYLLPVVLYAAWTSLAIWDLARRDDLGKPDAHGRP